MNILDRQRIIRSLYATRSNAEIAEILGMSASHVGVIALRMGVRKDPKYLSNTNSECARKRWKKRVGNV